jgi:hypothetical protein
LPPKEIARNEFDEAAATARTARRQSAGKQQRRTFAEKRPPRFEVRATFSGIAAGLPRVGN